MKKKMVVFAGMFLALLFLGTSCASIHSATRAEPHEVTSFLPDHERLERAPDDFPFHYISPIADSKIRKVKHLRIAPVNTDFLQLKREGDTGGTEIDDEVQETIEELGQFMHDQFVEEFKKIDYPEYCSLTDDPNEKDCWVIEPAIVALVPTGAVLNVVGDVVGFVVPGASMAASVFSQGSISIEVRVRDALTDEIIAMAATTEADELAVISLAKYNWLASARNNISMIARMSAKCFMADDLNEVKRESPVKFFAI